MHRSHHVENLSRYIPQLAIALANTMSDLPPLKVPAITGATAGKLREESPMTGNETSHLALRHTPSGSNRNSLLFRANYRGAHAHEANR